MQTALSLAGGLALFLFGMERLTEGLTGWAGERLRDLLRRAAGGRGRGLALGIVLGALMQTSAGTVMVAGFVHAGLLTLAQSLPITLGLNIGTTLAVQLIAFRVADYAPLAVAAGVLLRLTGGDTPRRPLGDALLGFGLFLMGMSLMSGALRPHREALAPWLVHFDGTNPRGLLLGTLSSLAITAVIQSSSATIGMAFALIASGAITRFEQVYPILIGANIGTCVTAILGSLGSNREGKRAAYAHLIFNIYGGLVGLLAAPLFYRWIGFTADSLERQAAHANTIKMAASALLLLPILPAFAALVRALAPSREPPPETSRLDAALCATPEDALRAVIAESQRGAALCRESHALTRRLILEPRPPAYRRIQRNEEAADRMKSEVRDYLKRLTRHYLSRRQSLLIAQLDRIVWNLERIHDHITVVASLSQQRYGVEEARLYEEDLDRLFDLHESAGATLARLEEALAPTHADFAAAAAPVVAAFNAFLRAADAARAEVTDKVSRHLYPPISGLFFSEYATTFERMVRHARQIAELLRDPDFRIKETKLGREAPPPRPFRPPELVNVDDYLARRDRLRRRCEQPPPRKENPT